MCALNDFSCHYLNILVAPLRTLTCSLTSIYALLTACCYCFSCGFHLLALVAAYSFMVDLINLKSNTNCYAFNCRLWVRGFTVAPTQVHYIVEPRCEAERKPQSCRTKSNSPSQCVKMAYIYIMQRRLR